MSRLCSVTVCACLLAAGQGLAQLAAPTAPKPPDPPREPRPAPAEGADDEVTVCLHDGSVVRKVALPGSVELQTKYGKLTIPVRDVRRIEFGFRLSAEAEKQIDEAVRQLGGGQFRQREAAARRLLELGARAYPALLRAAQSKDVEVARRAGGLVQLIQQSVPPDQLQLRPHDTVVTAECVLVGRLAGDSIRGKTKSFGEIQLKLTDLRSVHSPADAAAGHAVSAFRGPVTPTATPDIPVLPPPATVPLPAPAAPPAPPPPATAPPAARESQ